MSAKKGGGDTFRQQNYNTQREREKKVKFTEYRLIYQITYDRQY